MQFAQLWFQVLRRIKRYGAGRAVLRVVEPLPKVVWPFDARFTSPPRGLGEDGSRVLSGLLMFSESRPRRRFSARLGSAGSSVAVVLSSSLPRLPVGSRLRSGTASGVTLDRESPGWPQKNRLGSVSYVAAPRQLVFVLFRTAPSCYRPGWWVWGNVVGKHRRAGEPPGGEPRAPPARQPSV